jgi:REP element-mobilizing transposase RayT
MHRAAIPHGHALRLGRFSEVNRIYVVTSVTFGRKPLFLELDLGRIVVNTFRHQESLGRAFTLAYVVMPDHFHWLLQLGPGTTLSGVVQSTKAHAGKLVKRALGLAEDRIWQPGFHDHAVRREEDLTEIARYIVANPLRAGLARSIREYSLWDAVWLPSSL